jgi:hypothetical protein
MFAGKLQKFACQFRTASLPACNNSITVEEIFVKFRIGQFHQTLLAYSGWGKFGQQHRTRVRFCACLDRHSRNIYRKDERFEQKLQGELKQFHGQ